MRDKAPGTRVYRLDCKRGLGMDLRLPETELRFFDKPLESFLEDMSDRESHRHTPRIAEQFLAPRPHAAMALQVYATDALLLPPAHPLLMTQYGMAYELIAARGKDRSKDDGMPSEIARAVWETLRHRFGAFLFQQQQFIVRHTLGVLP